MHLVLWGKFPFRYKGSSLYIYSGALKPMQQRMERKAQKQKQKDETGEGAGDVMSDLKKRLLLRRTGISGHKQEGGAHMEKRESMLEQMSYIIPPPRSEDMPEVVLEEPNEDWSS